MEQKSTFKRLRDGLQQGIYCVINPLVRGMIKIGITPNIVTTIGLLGNVAAAALIAWAAYTMSAAGSPAPAIDYSVLTVAGAVIIIFSLFDMLDGQVARLGGMVSRFGALYDSVLDRYCELLTLGAISYFMFAAGYPGGALVTFLALVGSIMVSYVRARAEGLDIDCKVGFMQRPERVVITVIGLLAAGITGSGGAACDPMIILIVAMAVIAVFANITAFARLAHCRRALADKH